MKFIKNISAFLNALFHNPRSIGAVVPSSKYLAKSMVDNVDVSLPGYILELGPGTGAITQVMLQSIPPDKIITLEISPTLAEKLKEQFPAIQVITGDATHLSALLQGKKIHTIISSLPLLLLTKHARDLILSEIPKVLSPNGKFIQYTYALNNTDAFYPKEFLLEKSFIIWRNIPPAKVAVFRVKQNPLGS